MSLRSELKGIAHGAPGGLKTRQNHKLAVGRMCDFFQSHNLQVSNMSKLRTKHLQRYAQDMVARGCSPRTMQTEFASLRSVLRAAGRAKLAGNLSNSDLGIAGASRSGTHRRMPDEMYRALHDTLVQHGAADVAACAALQREFGLRAKEAVMAGDSLGTWAKTLAEGNECFVNAGTKGGKDRWVTPPDLPAARAAVQEALALRDPRTQFIIGGGRDLKQGMTRHRNTMYRAGARGEYSGHSLRSVFACAKYDQYRAQGLTDKEAARALSHEMGHGDGRGRWVVKMYLNR